RQRFETLLQSLDIIPQSLALRVGALMQVNVALQVDDAGQDLEAALRRRVEQLLGLALEEQNRRGERLVTETDVLLDPLIEAAALLRALDGVPAERRLAIELLRRVRLALLGALQGAVDLVAGAVEGELEGDAGLVAVLVDEFVRVSAAAAVMAE